MDPATSPPAQPPVYGCYRHPERPTAIGCQRCGRPICGECMLPASVGFQCPDCVAAARASSGPVTARRDGLAGTLTAAPVTTTLIAINVLIWVAVLLTGGNSSDLTNRLALQNTALCGLGSSGYFGLTALQCAAQGGTWFPGVSDGAPWLMVTSMFLHIEALHLALNMLALWFLGPPLERFFGRTRYVLLYLLSGLTGAVAVYWLSAPYGQTLGASGAVFGLMGGLLIVALRRGGDVRTVLMWLAINIAFTFAGGAGISWQGHLGGLVGGVLVTLILVRARGRSRSSLTWVLLAGYAVLLAALTVIRTMTLG